MKSEKVKEIKKTLEETLEYCARELERKLFQDCLTLINELESENERLLEQRNKTYNIWVKDTEQLKDRIAELEEQRDRQAYIAEELIQEKHRWTEQASKGTAKEIYSWLKEHTFDSSFEIIKTFFKEKYGVEE